MAKGDPENPEQSRVIFKKNIMKNVKYGLAAAVLAIAFSAFTTPGAQKNTAYWVYTSPDNQEFQYAIKYEIQQLPSPSAPGCDELQERPCVLQEVSEIGPDTLQLHNYLQSMGSDSSIVASALTTKSAE